jgi:sec-independent protein translocase protein TatB
MFDIGFAELVVISILALLVIGPKRLPEVIRTLGLWVGRLRRSFRALKSEMESELQLDEVRRQLHNEDIMRNLEQAESTTKDAIKSTEQALKDLLDTKTPAAGTQSSPVDTQPDQNAADKS